ncbi:MAG: hypothetical protein AAFP04_00805 [Myxococcota bacterium]
MRTLVLVPGFVALGFGLGRTAIQTERLEILNADGGVAVSIQAHGSGAGLLTLHDRDGRPAVQISAAEGGRLSLSNTQGSEVAYVGPVGDGYGALIGDSSKAAPIGIRLLSDPKGRGSAAFSDGEGRVLKVTAKPAHHSLHFGSEWHPSRTPERGTSHAKEHFFLDESRQH